MIKRFDQTSLESKVTQTKVSVLSPAIEPLEPASPNISKNIVVTFLLAVLLGCGAAILIESLDRRIRSIQDLEEMLQVPVLAVLSPPKKHNRLAQLTSQTLRLELK
jgi:polysaccharide biosynthesis transport protein